MVALTVVAGLLAYVVPQVTEVFLRGGQALPWPTRALLAVSEGSARFGPWLVLASAASAAAIAAFWRRPDWLRRRHALWLRLPTLGTWIVKVEVARFVRTLALLGGSAVPLPEALRLAGGTVRNRVLAEALETVEARVREGVSLSRALAAIGRFPPVALRLIASGERAGRLDAMLDEAAEQIERELDTTTQVAAAALGPATILIVGALVLFIVLAILLPIFQMNQSIR